MDRQTLEMIVEGTAVYGSFIALKPLIWNLKWVKPAKIALEKEIRKPGIMGYFFGKAKKVGKGTLCHVAGHAISLSSQAALCVATAYLAEKYPPIKAVTERCSGYIVKTSAPMMPILKKYHSDIDAMNDYLKDQVRYLRKL